MRFRCVLAAIALISWASSASAHPAPFSYLDVVFRNGAIEGSLTVHIIDIAHELGLTPPEKLLDASLVESERRRSARSSRRGSSCVPVAGCPCSGRASS
jgi:hypothetical protein